MIDKLDIQNSSELNDLVRELRNSTGPVTELDTRRLRRDVLQRLPAVPGRGSQGLRMAVAAAAGLALLGSVYTARLGPRVDAPELGAGARMAVARGDDGSVVFRFRDERKEHRIVRDDAPVPGADAEVRIARGGVFVDRAETPRPGQVIFYRID